MAWYSTGTVAVTNNSSTVTGTGTAFDANSRVGDAFLGPDGAWYEVTNIASGTVLSIKPTYKGATASGQGYSIAPLQGYVKDSADALRGFVNQYGVQLASLGPWSTAASASDARDDLGLGAVAVEDVIPVAKGGTGAATAGDALASLGALSSLYPGMRNLLINGDMRINQRAFAGGYLAAGVYGVDRWRGGISGGVSGCTLSVSGYTIALNGSMAQTIEGRQEDFSGKVFSVSVENPSASIAVELVGGSGATTAGVIDAGTGRKWVTLTAPAGTYTNGMSVRITASSSTTFARIQVEYGDRATAWDRRAAALELLMCQRYYEEFVERAIYIGTNGSTNGYTSISLNFKATKRIVPAMSFGSDGTANRIRISDTPLYSTNASVGATTVDGTSIISTGDAASRTLISCYVKADAEL